MVADGIYLELTETIAEKEHLFKGYGNVRWDNAEGRWYWEAHLSSDDQSISLNSAGIHFSSRAEATFNLMRTFKWQDYQNSLTHM